MKRAKRKRIAFSWTVTIPEPCSPPMLGVVQGNYVVYEIDFQAFGEKPPPMQFTGTKYYAVR